MINAIINGSIYDGATVHKNASILFNDGVVLEIGSDLEIPQDIENVFDLKGGYLVPGFIDLQVNGGGGALFNNEPTVDAIRRIGEAHRQYGTTGFFPTLITTDYDVMRQAVQAVDDAIEQGVPGVLGIHLEGPFLNEENSGAHDVDKFCVIDEEGFDVINSLKRGKTIVTIAPELTTTEMISRIRAAGITICIGHSAATYEQSCEALEAGVTGFTHLYNGMTPLQSRSPGIVGAALADQNSWFGIIADGHHMHPASFRVAVAAKQKGGAVLVTDAMPTVGSDKDYFVLDGEKIYSKEGRCTNAAGSLAGSDLDMISAVRNAVKFADLEWLEAVNMASLYPANAVGLNEELGRIEAGYTANFTALNLDWDVCKTWVDGIESA